MVGSTIILLASSFLLYGISNPINNTANVRLKEDALEELTKYTNQWQSYVAAGYDPIGGTQPVYGDEVFIGENDNIEARMYHEITEKYTGQYSKYYNIKTWIEWEKDYQGKNKNRLDFEVNQMVF